MCTCRGVDKCMDSLHLSDFHLFGLPVVLVLVTDSLNLTLQFP